MLSRLEFREAAVTDLLQIHDYFNDQVSLALADRFLAAVERTAQQIRRYPNAGSSVHTHRPDLMGLRWWSVADFPRYLLYYAISPEYVEIVRVLHSSRNAAKELRGATS